MSKDDKELLSAKILESPAGQDALETLAKTYASTGGDTGKGIASAIDRAKQLGIWEPFEASLTIDVFTKLGPILYKYLKISK
jgi:hypothetical protein